MKINRYTGIPRPKLFFEKLKENEFIYHVAFYWNIYAVWEKLAYITASKEMTIAASNIDSKTRDKEVAELDQNYVILNKCLFFIQAGQLFTVNLVSVLCSWVASNIFLDELSKLSTDILY